MGNRYVINVDNIMEIQSNMYHLLWSVYILQINELINSCINHPLYLLHEEKNN